jgi:hypothetical protein
MPGPARIFGQIYGYNTAFLRAPKYKIKKNHLQLCLIRIADGFAFYIHINTNWKEKTKNAERLPTLR